MRVKHLSPRTEEAYLGWMRRYHEFHGRKDPATLGAAHVTAFLSALATERKVAASTQNQALAALLFLYREVLGVELPWLDDVVRARGQERLPVVLSREEVRAVLCEMQGVTRLMATMLYGSGLRLLECCRLRVKDVDFGRRQIVVRRGKGDKDRVTMLPAIVADDLAAHLERVRTQHRSDVERGAGWVELPDALARKLPSAGSNAYIVDGAGRVVTRPLGHEILGGVTREVVLELARREGIGVVERPFTVEEAVSAREAFLTSTSSLVLPVTRIDGRPVGDGRPGPATVTLLRRYREHMWKER